MHLLQVGPARGFAAVVCLAAALAGVGCGRVRPPVAQAASQAEQMPPDSPRERRLVRATGTIQPVRFYTVQVPQITGQGGRMTLVRLAPNGATVKAGELIADFDRTQQLDNARDAQARFDDLSHQVEQRQAQNRADSARRIAELQRAEADLAKAEIKLRKGPLLSEIERLQNEVRMEAAKAHVASLKKSNKSHDTADAASLRILELQRDRQKVTLERALRNAARLEVKAPLKGMVALESIWKGGFMGQAQEGDQLYPGQAIMRIFDPSEMEVRLAVGEPDGASLVEGAKAEVRLDAYPDLVFRAHFDSASPAAASALGSPIKTFAARFRLERTDKHLLPDLSAAVVIEPPEGAKK